MRGMKKIEFQKKLLFWLVAFILISFIAVPTALQNRAEAATKKIVPGQVSLTKIACINNASIRIGWQKTSGATHYKIYYRKTGTTKWIEIATVGSSKSAYTHINWYYEKNIIEIGQKYDFTVRGYNSKYKTYGKYDTKGLTASTKPDEPSLDEIALSSNKKLVKISWAVSGGSERYIIYRKTPETKWKKIASVGPLTTSYIDRKPIPGKVNSYMVRGFYSGTYNGKKCYSDYDKNGLSIRVPDPKNPDIPIKEIRLNAKYVTLTKNKPTFQLEATVYPENATDKTLIWDRMWMVTTELDNSHKLSIKPEYMSKSGQDFGAVTVHSKDGKVSATCYIDVILRSDISKYPEKILELVNKEREKYGLQPVSLNEKLQQAAQIRAEELWKSFDHKRPDGSDCFTVLDDFGIRTDTAMENIAMGQNTCEFVMSTWMGSPIHRTNILNSSAKYLGAGVYESEDGTLCWTQLFTGNIY